jgi:hypothetical protein
VAKYWVKRKRSPITLMSRFVNLMQISTVFLHLQLRLTTAVNCKLPCLCAATHGIPQDHSCQHQTHSETYTSASHHPPDATDGVHNGMSHCFPPVESQAIQDDQTHCLKIFKRLHYFLAVKDHANIQ